jgi:hypothetical protein
MLMAVVWYPDQETWQSIRDSADDPDRFEDSYEAWVEMLEESFAKLVTGGLFPVKAPFNADEYHAWCRSESKAQDAVSRSEYAALLLQRMDEPNRRLEAHRRRRRMRR